MLVFVHVRYLPYDVTLSMQPSVQTVGIFGKNRDSQVGEHVAALVGYLQKRGLKVVVEESTATLLPSSIAPSQPIDAIGAAIDLAIVIGGDGTILRVSRHIALHQVPIIGVNLGRVGFLADVRIGHMTEEVGKILDGDAKITQRMLLHAEVLRDGAKVHEEYALNDVIITKGELARLIEFETWLDGEFVSATRADGIIVASPTGSTAYALSAGGPIIHSDLHAIVLVPICPHTLSHRPIVVSGESVVEVMMTVTTPGQNAHVTFDGQTTFSLEDNDRVRVRHADISVKLVHPKERSYFDVLRRKMHWGRQL